MKQKYWFIFAALAAAAFLILSFVMSKRQQDQMQELSQKKDEMNIKVDELDVETKSMATESKITTSAIKDADQRISALEDKVNSSETESVSEGDPVNLVFPRDISGI